MRIIVTGAGGPAGINFIKSLKLADPNIFIVGTDINRYRIHLSPSDEKVIVPRCNDPDYLDTLVAIADTYDAYFIHPQPDVEVGVIADHQDELFAKYEIDTFLPKSDTVRICHSKYLSNQFWRDANVPTAACKLIRGPKDVDDAFREFGSPIWIRASSGAGGKGSTPCETSRTAYAWIDYWKSRGRNMTFLAQEYLEGRNLAWHSLWRNGELITSMARERLEYIYPYLSPSGITGTPTVQKTIHSDAVNEVGYEAVRAIDLNYSGLACVDLKEDKDGVPRATEINPGRMFTTSYFFSYLSWQLIGTDVGNFPYNYLKVAFNEEVDLPPFDSLPKDIYWIRHLDTPPKLLRGREIVKV